jgi:ABC-type glycerol-3-phosphate transport system permease component
MNLHTEPATLRISQGVLLFVAAVFAAPMVIAVSVAMRGGGLTNFITVLTDANMARFMLNSILVAAGTIALVLTAATLAAYAFVALPIAWNSALLLFLVAPLMIPPASIFLPIFIDVRALGLLNTLPAVIGPVSALTIPVMLMLIRSFLMGVPRAILDAAKVDGSNSFQTLRHILLPMMKPILTVCTVWTFLAAWNEYFLPLVFLRKVESQVVSMAPKYFTIDERTPNVGLQFAALLLISLPTLLLFLYFRKYLLRPVSSGAVK